MMAEDILERIFAPESLLPEQYFDRLKNRKHPLSPERRLVLAVMQDAIECFQGYLGAKSAKRRQLYLDAERWIDADDDFSPLSFTNICGLLGLDADYLRNGLHVWRARELCRRKSPKPSRDYQASIAALTTQPEGENGVRACAD